MLKEFDLTLLFQNDALLMRSERGMLMDVELSELSAIIPHLTADGVLTIDAVGKGTGQEVTQVMMAGSLSDSVGEALSESVQVTGEMATAINLHIPFGEGKWWPVVWSTSRITISISPTWIWLTPMPPVRFLLSMTKFPLSLQSQPVRTACHYCFLGLHG